MMMESGRDASKKVASVTSLMTKFFFAELSGKTLTKSMLRMLLEMANRDNAFREFYKVKKRGMLLPEEENEVKRFTFCFP